MRNPTKSIEEIEQEMYRVLLAEIPNLPPEVARGLARVAAERLRQRRAANEKPPATPEKPTNKPKLPEDLNNEREP
ncbi:MAG: hypothetical protein ABSH48_16820 [Verrucomicrobiota bacterium]|jgi:hypothetical protein